MENEKSLAFGGYMIEGHVPVADIRRLLDEHTEPDERMLDEAVGPCSPRLDWASGTQ